MLRAYLIIYVYIFERLSEHCIFRVNLGSIIIIFTVLGFFFFFFFFCLTAFFFFFFVSRVFFFFGFFFFFCCCFFFVSRLSFEWREFSFVILQSCSVLREKCFLLHSLSSGCARFCIIRIIEQVIL